MECICVICEESPSAGLLKDHATIFYNLTSLEISDWENIHLLKICDACKEKLLQFDIFRRLCITVCTKLRQNSKTHIPSVSSSFVKLEGNCDGFSDCDLPDDTKSDMECMLENPVGKPSTMKANMSNNDASDSEKQCDVDEEHSKDEPENEDDPFSRNSNRAEKNTRNPLECHLCARKFRNPVRFEGHVRTHQGLKPALCKLCGKEFITYRNLKRHMRNKHTDAPRILFRCDFEGCESSFATKQGMMLHRKKHDPGYTLPDPKAFVCEACGKTFSTSGALKKHSYIHTGNMPFHCTVCDKRYPTAHKLKEHTMRHQGIKNHTCPHCGLKKTTMHELRVHLNYHTKEKTYPCDFCEQIFLNGGNLRRHIRIVHQKIKSFNCPHCSQSFGKAETLKHHIMTHTGERPHACTICGKRFIQLVALRKHAKIHDKSEKRKTNRNCSTDSNEDDTAEVRTE
uniref:C2H2-type domain-containing protein n=1 Tax=Anopheles atroparvus TaxID=41427 RepID=A0AAG5D0M2_ANOAO